MTDINKLEELAKAATPGPWTAYNMVHADRGAPMTPEELGEYVANSVRLTRAEGGSDQFLFIEGGGKDICLVGNGPKGPANAAFMEATGPAEILSLISQYRRMEEALRECADDLENEIKSRADNELPRRIARDMETVTRARQALQDQDQ